MKSRFRLAVRYGNRAVLLIVMLLAVVAMACDSDEQSAAATDQTATPQPTLTNDPTVDAGREVFATVPGIDDPANFGWPRAITTSTGTIEISAPPERIYSLSLGHAEIVAALRGGDVFVATASFFKDPATSASYAEFVGSPDAGSDPEEIIALDPEIVIASAFTSADLVAQLKGVGVHVVRADLEDSALGNVPNILLLGYMLGAEDRALELAQEVTDRVNAVTERVDEANPERPRVIAIARFSSIFIAGEGSTEGGIIESAGGINGAAEAGIVAHQNIAIEGIAAINPEIILVTQPEDSALVFAEELYSDPSLAEVPAVMNRRILFAEPAYYTTLSHWNVRGIEESARIFFPELFEGVNFQEFSHP